jgi:hypothetical protein
VKYALLVYEDQSPFGDEKTTEAANQNRARHVAFAERLGSTFTGGAGLKGPGTATTVRTSANGAKTVHDGPFAETKEQLGGFYLIEAPDLDAAIEIARGAPIWREGAIEVRPVLGPG